MSARLLADQRGRAALFAAAGLAALLLAVPLSIWLAQSPRNLTQTDRLGAEIGCVCGTCPLRPIGTCGCGFADDMLARLDQEVAAGKTDAEIMAAFAAEYGSSIKIKPEGSGVGLIAWLAPMAFLMVGAVAMAGIISHWRAQQDPQDAGSSTTPAGTTTKHADPAKAHVGIAKTSEGMATAGDAPAGAGAALSPSAATDTDESDRYRHLVERELDDFNA